MTCPYCNIFYGIHMASCKMLRHEHPEKPVWVRVMESRNDLRL